jgi:hypothetical protein
LHGGGGCRGQLWKRKRWEWKGKGKGSDVVGSECGGGGEGGEGELGEGREGEGEWEKERKRVGEGCGEVGGEGEKVGASLEGRGEVERWG